MVGGRNGRQLLAENIDALALLLNSHSNEVTEKLSFCPPHYYVTSPPPDFQTLRRPWYIIELFLSFVKDLYI